MSGPSERAALARVPDHPRWVDTRGMLLTARAVVSFHQPAHLDTDGFVVELASRALLSAFDNPPASLIAQRASALAGNERTRSRLASNRGSGTRLPVACA